MTIIKLSPEHLWLQYPAFFNAYPILNEIAGVGSDIGVRTSKSYGEIYLDDYYGRIFDRHSQDIGSKYGRSNKMHHYVRPRAMEIIDEMRVPYRRIPIFLANDVKTITDAIDELQRTNSSYEVLLRGQTRTYLVERPEEESTHFYGEAKVKEPSFLPSHLRNKFDPHFLKCMWQSQAAILLNDIAYDLGPSFAATVTEFRSSPLFLFFALGIAQHYGMPSVGLDLTDRLDVACWFATHKIMTAPTGKAATALVDLGSDVDVDPTVFVFRCPKDAVFDYEAARPKDLPTGRPDRQAAWFGFVGWGLSLNQLASYLMCGFRLSKDIVADQDPALDRNLFPYGDDDVILQYFLKMRAMEKYEGEAKRALGGIYYMSNS